jgi:hypothetical protein
MAPAATRALWRRLHVHDRRVTELRVLDYDDGTAEVAGHASRFANAQTARAEADAGFVRARPDHQCTDFCIEWIEIRRHAPGRLPQRR